MIVDMVFEMSLRAERYFFYGWRHVPHRGRIFIILSYLPHCQLATESSDKRRWQRRGRRGRRGEEEEEEYSTPVGKRFLY